MYSCMCKAAAIEALAPHAYAKGHEVLDPRHTCEAIDRHNGQIEYQYKAAIVECDRIVLKIQCTTPINRDSYP